ncbi:MAG: hypothetical protein HQ592_07060 [Planctomycetes bacterium]|nr:hypothetical protein [Planctomycetota bacterium]
MKKARSCFARWSLLPAVVLCAGDCRAGAPRDQSKLMTDPGDLHCSLAYKADARKAVVTFRNRTGEIMSLWLLTFRVSKVQDGDSSPICWSRRRIRSGGNPALIFYENSRRNTLELWPGHSRKWRAVWVAPGVDLEIVAPLDPILMWKDPSTPFRVVAELSVSPATVAGGEAVPIAQDVDVTSQALEVTIPADRDKE